MKDAHHEMRVFDLMRDEDISGISGVGRVAVGVVFPSGKVVLEWLGSHRTFGIYDNLADVERIHGHGGKTRIIFMQQAASTAYFVQVSRPAAAVGRFLTNRSGYRMKIRAILEFVHKQVRRKLQFNGPCVSRWQEPERPAPQPEPIPSRAELESENQRALFKPRRCARRG